jgi:tetratricopeptide (TPR) repeat protein
MTEAENNARNTGTCPQCGSPINSGVKFCRHCGAKIQEADAVPINVTEQAGPTPTESGNLQKGHKAGKIIVACSVAVVSVAIISVAAVFGVAYYKKTSIYNKGVECFNSEKYDDAIEEFNKVLGYKDSEDYIAKSKYNSALKLFEDEKYEEAKAAFEALGDYEDAKEQVEACDNALKEIDYQAAVKLFDKEAYEDAKAAFAELGDYKDAKKQVEACDTALKEDDYQAALELFNNGAYDDAKAAFIKLGDYKDSAEQAANVENEAKYEDAMELYNNGDYQNAQEAFSALGDYKDSEAYSCKCGDTIWKSAYINYIQSGAYMSLPSGFVGNTIADYDPAFELIYLDGDDIPELLVTGGYSVSIFTVKDGAIKPIDIDQDSGVGWYGGLQVVKGEGLFLNDYQRMGTYSTPVYKLEDGVATLQSKIEYYTDEYGENGQFYIDDEEVSSSEYLNELKKWHLNTYYTAENPEYAITDSNWEYISVDKSASEICNIIENS